MFRAYPGFENLPLRVEVQWQGRARPVVARLEQWPESQVAVVICSFEDEESDGEWLIMKGNSPYIIARPDKWIEAQRQFDAVTGESKQIWRFKSSGIGKFRANVHRPFAGQEDFSIVRVLYFANLPREPRLVLESADGLCWHSEKSEPNFVPFAVAAEQPLLSLSATEAQNQLRRIWSDQKSEAYFAWQWSTLSGAKRLEELSGSKNKKEEVTRIMQLVLQQSSTLWQLDTEWSWMLGFNADDLSIDSSLHFREQGNQILEEWISWLRTYYYCAWGQDIYDAHSCARQFWGNKSRWLGYAQRASAPNFHEQLEAKLQLRDWLQDKATTEQINQLLSI